jgi:UDP-2-acetamido-2-deoxy-ribo-hexuluronate aminotransferase
VVRNDRTCVWAQFTIQTDKRDALIASLREVGVPTAVHYPIPLHKQPAYQAICRVSGNVDVSDAVSKRVVSLPMHPYLDEVAMQTIVNALQKAANLI